MFEKVPVIKPEIEKFFSDLEARLLTKRPPGRHPYSVAKAVQAILAECQRIQNH